jgi:hypothetical protein
VKRSLPLHKGKMCTEDIFSSCEQKANCHVQESSQRILQRRCEPAEIETVCSKLVRCKLVFSSYLLKYELGFAKIFVEKNHNVIDLLTKNHPDPVHCLGEKLKTSPTGKFAVNPVDAL